MAKRIIWTKKSKSELFEIFEYWNTRNGSNLFSIKLNKLINKNLNQLLFVPEIGRITDIENVRVKQVNKYLIYYEVINENLYILSIRHEKRNPKNLILK